MSRYDGAAGSSVRSDDLQISVWFERDRRHLGLSKPDGSSVFDLWDEEVDEAIEDGLLTKPRHPRPSDEDWRIHLLAYARAHGLIS